MNTVIPKMKFSSKLTGLLLVLAFVFRWQIVQAAAWLWMLASYSVSHGMGEAWRMTFSGEYPCVICRMMESAGPWELSVWSAFLDRPLLLAVPLVLGLFGLASLARFLILSRLGSQAAVLNAR